MSDSANGNGKKRKFIEEEEAGKGEVKDSTGGATAFKISKKPTVLDRVVFALRTLNVPSSAQAVVKVCTMHNEIQYSDAKKIRKAIQDALKSGKLVVSPESKLKFWVAGEPTPEVEKGPEISILIDVEGTDSEAPIEIGNLVEIHYQLALASVPKNIVERSGKTMFSFRAGAGDVIKGMDAAVLNMRLNGKRTVLIPWQLAYGKRGSGKDIPPESDLIFSISVGNVSDWGIC